MTLLAGLFEKARAQRRTIVLPEGEDARILAAAAKAVSTGIATIKLLGKPEHIQRTARERHISLDGLEIIDPATDSDRRQACVHTLQTLRRDKTGRDMPRERALHKACQPLTFAHLMLRTGDADGCVAGAVHTTQRVISSALQMIGQHADSKLVSSFFLMQHSLPHQGDPGDCIVCGLRAGNRPGCGAAGDHCDGHRQHRPAAIGPDADSGAAVIFDRRQRQPRQHRQKSNRPAGSSPAPSRSWRC